MTGPLDPVDPPYPCACCGHLVLAGPPGSHEICPICFWEDDAVQLRWPDLADGANAVPLRDAQRNASTLGAVRPRLVAYTRSPTDDDRRDAGWRTIDDARDDFEDADDAATAPWPQDRTVLYWWRPTFWRR